MNLLIARGGLEGSDVLAFLLSAGILLVIVLIVIAKLREAIAPRRIGNRMKRFFGPDVKLLQAHEKTFPGWDLGSLSRAVASFVDECCESSQRLGSVAVACSIQPLIPTEQENALARAKPVTLTYERLPVDVERDESFVSNALYFAITRPDVTAQARAASGRVSTGHFTLDPRGGGGGSTRAASAPAARERIAIFLAKDTVSVGAAEHELFDSDEGGRAPQATASRLLLSIACRSREVADFFFAEIERRRQALSIYRGKVIEPVINHGGVQSIAFRKLEPMSAQELELPDTVKQLIDNSIVAFYESRDTLQSMGVELKRGVLFHSPPGTGKTSICRYLAGLLSNFTVCFVSGRRLLYPRELCRMARYLQPAMLVFEDIDLIAQERDTNGLATILGELMNQIDECEPCEQVLFVMNTNSLERLERAVRDRAGRVDQIIDVPLPDQDARGRLIRRFAKATAPSEGDIARVAAATEGATPATLKEVVKRAAVMAVRTAGRGADPRDLRLSVQDLLLAYEQVGRNRKEGQHRADQ